MFLGREPQHIGIRFGYGNIDNLWFFHRRRRHHRRGWWNLVVLVDGSILVVVVVVLDGSITVSGSGKYDNHTN